MLEVVGDILIFLLNVYFWIIVIGVILSWLIAFDVVNIRNEQAANLVRLLNKLTDPVYRPLRKYIPPIAGIDLTPIIVLIAIKLLEQLVAEIFCGGYCG